LLGQVAGKRYQRVIFVGPPYICTAARRPRRQAVVPPATLRMARPGESWSTELGHHCYTAPAIQHRQRHVARGVPETTDSGTARQSTLRPITGSVFRWTFTGQAQPTDLLPAVRAGGFWQRGCGAQCRRIMPLWWLNCCAGRRVVHGEPGRQVVGGGAGDGCVFQRGGRGGGGVCAAAAADEVWG
jgi:hypothetical protein